jgi:tellurite resistance protein TehA-like permease
MAWPPARPRGAVVADEAPTPAARAEAIAPGWLEAKVRRLFPGYFALVMATGIVSNGFYFLGHRPLSLALLVVNLVAYPLLLAATALRALRFGRELWADLVNPRLVFTFFTVVAATDILGAQLLLRGHEDVAIGLWLFALAVWVLLGYFSFAVLAFDDSDTGVDVVHGGWLIAIVGTESLVVLGTPLAPQLGSASQLAFVTVYTLWGVGIALYGIFVTLFAYRLFFTRLEAGDMNPLFWVVMGAAAIAANAGSTLILNEPDLPFLLAMRPFVDGTTLLLWAWATWWIPLLVIFGVWRHLVRGQPLRYHPTYWSLVFPLGMYTVATYRLSLAADYSPIQTMARGMVWVAFAAWAVALLGLVRSLAGRERSAAARA